MNFEAPAWGKGILRVALQLFEPDTARLEDDEVASDLGIWNRGKRLGDDLDQLLGRNSVGVPKEDDPVMCAERIREEIPETPVRGNQGSPLADRKRQNRRIGLALQPDIPDILSVYAGSAKGSRQGSGQVFVDEVARHGSGRRPDLLTLHELSRVGEAGQNIFPGDRVLIDHLFDRRSGGELAKHDVHGDSRPFDDRLSVLNLVINGDPWGDFLHHQHQCTLSKR